MYRFFFYCSLQIGVCITLIGPRLLFLILMITFEFFISVKGREARNDSCYYGRTAGRIFESYSWTGVPIEPNCGFTQRYHRKPRGKRETGFDTLIDKYLPET